MDFKLISKKLLQFILIVITISGLGAIFGSQNNLVAVSLVTAFMFFKDLGLGLKPKTGSMIMLLAFPAIGIVTHFLQGYVWIGLLVNIISISMILVLSGPKYAEKCYLPFMLTFIFLQGNPVDGVVWFLRLTELVAGGVVLAASYYINHKNDEEQMCFKNHMNRLKESPKIIGFIARLTIGISISIVIGMLINVPKIMWISIVIVSLTQITKEGTHERIKHRVMASFIGVMLFIFIVNIFIPEEFYGITLLLLGFVHSFFDEYKYQQIITTVSVLTVSVAILGNAPTILNRLSLLGIGIIVVVVLHEIQNMIEKNSKSLPI